VRHGSETYLDRLIGREVTDLRGRRIGHLEEIRAEPKNGALEVTQYVIGAFGLVERLAMQPVFHHSHGYVARWDQLDLSDVEHPRLNCSTSELELRR
jgi:hypothetical protein